MLFLSIQMKIDVTDSCRIRVDQDRDRSTAVRNSGNLTVQSTVQIPSKPGNPENSNSIEFKNNPYSHLSDEELKKEMIRQAMSELGKRSAAARAKRKVEAEEVTRPRIL
jgi:hypothetical protein